MTREEFARGEFALGYMFCVSLADGWIRIQQPEKDQKGKEKRK